MPYHKINAILNKARKTERKNERRKIRKNGLNWISIWLLKIKVSQNYNTKGMMGEYRDKLEAKLATLWLILKILTKLPAAFELNT